MWQDMFDEVVDECQLSMACDHLADFLENYYRATRQPLPDGTYSNLHKRDSTTHQSLKRANTLNRPHRSPSRAGSFLGPPHGRLSQRGSIDGSNQRRPSNASANQMPPYDRSRRDSSQEHSRSPVRGEHEESPPSQRDHAHTNHVTNAAPPRVNVHRIHMPDE